VWKPVYKDEGSIGPAIYAGDSGACEFEFGDGMFISIGSMTDIKKKDFNMDELNDFLAYYNGLDAVEYNGLYYITDTTSRFFNDFDRSDDDEHTMASDSKYKEYKEEAGARRVHYQGLSANGDITSLCFVGKQVGNRLEKADEVDCLSCYENVHTREELIETDKFWVSAGAGVGLVFNFVLIAMGIFLIVTKPGTFKSLLKPIKKIGD
jgi:hypothetical protein